MFFLLVDCGCWELDDLEVFKSEKEVQCCFAEKYYTFEPWENLDDSELLSWFERLDDDLNSFVYGSLHIMED